jgi:peptidoglycan hydrolase-like protein with peptidoglycan-binding domain
MRLILCVLTILIVSLVNLPVQAATHKHRHYVSHHQMRKHHYAAASKHAKHAKARSGSSKTQIAQTHLINTGYLIGKADGKIGSKTTAAIKKFQREHKLGVTGRLTSETFNAIVAADRVRAMASLPFNSPSVVATTPDFYAAHPDFYGYYDQQHENAGMLGFPQNVYSRFAKLELSEDISSQNKHYNITFNDEPLMAYDGQPSIIGISRTYSLGSEDVILLTGYQDRNTDCAFSHTLLVINQTGKKLLPIQNCTRGYQAKVANDSLFIIFPEADDGRDVGATWRYENGDVTRL